MALDDGGQTRAVDEGDVAQVEPDVAVFDRGDVVVDRGRRDRVELAAHDQGGAGVRLLDVDGELLVRDALTHTARPSLIGRHRRPVTPATNAPWAYDAGVTSSLAEGSNAARGRLAQIGPWALGLGATVLGAVLGATD